MHFRRFRTRLLVAIATLVALAQGGALLLVWQFNRANVEKDIREGLQAGEKSFRHEIEQRSETLAVKARLMATDWALRPLLARPEDRATLTSALRSYRDRIGAPPLVALLDAQGQALAAATAVGLTMNAEDWGPLQALAAKAEEDEAEEPSASGYALLGKQLHLLLVVPVYAPRPQVVAWLGLAFSIDKEFVDSLSDATRLDVTFAQAEPFRVLVSTLPSAQRAGPLNEITEQSLAGEPYLTLTLSSEVRGAKGVGFILQLRRSLNEALAPVRKLQDLLVVATLLSIAAGSVLAMLLARSLSRPVRLLTEHTRRIAAGDYVTRIHLERKDELGTLADSFNQLSIGLAERDQVRDLLDKNVSPEVAASLLRDGSALGGEEREATVLFCDLRGFTTLSEELSPRELITLLNRYLDRLTGALEREGGLVDKFIGDEIMALFGVPVPMADSAGSAVRAAVAMRHALDELNQELREEGRPPLAFGVGINTGHVVAGRIGSHTRLNYTVVGDGVNLAARLQPLTRKPEYATDIIISAAVAARLGPEFRLRDLGETGVKGRAATARIYAVEGIDRPVTGTV